MAPKRKADSSDGSASKKRKAIIMEFKVDIIKRSEKGETLTNIGRSLGLSRSTVATIIKDKERIVEHMKGSASMKATVITKQRSGLIIEMERLLVLWLEDRNQRHIPVSLMVIQEKAKRMFNALKKEKGEGSESEEFVASRASKERLTLLLGGNAAGDFKLKPLLVYQAENPRALNGIWKSQLPVIWRSNKKAWVTLAVFEDWFVNYFVPSVERYCTSKGIPFKVLLVLDNPPGHPAQLENFNPNVKMVYLPPNTTALLQPMDQGVIASFKAYYLRRTIAMALQGTETNKDLTLKDFRKSYDTLDAVKNIADSWEEVKQTNMNGVWKKMCPQFVNDFHGFEDSSTC
ncbi:tigger transposable element-derived protein 1-like [Macrobrachium nipponense]|uniref:tigger transposable element-derived protein 1-like n=1 Tax=Macrobrachium nipponense TaxID=159736 RepID=UPI0030C82172